MARVLITSMATVTPIGTGNEEFFASLAGTRSGIGDIVSFDTAHFPQRVGAQAVRGGEVVKNSGGLDRKELFLDDALQQISETPAMRRFDAPHRQLMIGAGIDYLQLEELCGSADAETHQWVPYSVNTQKMTERLAAKYQIGGGSNVNVSACVASSQSMGLAFRTLRAGSDRVIVAGGVDSMLNPLHYIGFYKLGALAPDSCRPYDLHRKGLVLGEGAVLFTFESEQTARPDTVLAEVCGYHSTMDAYRITDPRPEGDQLVNAARRAIEQAGISVDQIDCVHTHGTGTPKNDVMECGVLEQLFGDRYTEIPVFSMKSRVGHLIAACGAVEFGACIYSLQQQEVPATVNYETPDPEIPLNVLRAPRKMRIRYILKLNAAFGGQNTAFVLKKYE